MVARLPETRRVSILSIPAQLRSPRRNVMSIRLSDCPVFISYRSYTRIDLELGQFQGRFFDASASVIQLIYISGASGLRKQPDAFDLTCLGV